MDTLEQRGKSHGVLDNMWFYTKIWAKTFPTGLFMIPLLAAFTILYIYEQINIPRVLVEVLEKRGDMMDMLRALTFPALFLILSKTMNGVLNSGIMSLGSRPMIYLYSVPINEKLFSIHYQTLTSPKVQSKLVKARNIAFSGDGPGIHFFGVTVSGLLTAVAGAVIFTSSIVFVDPILLVVILLSGFVNLFYGFFVGKYVSKSMKERSDDEKKESYIIRVLESRMFAKDIRLYRMRDWLYSKFSHYHRRHSKYLLGETRIRVSAIVLNALMVLVRDLIAYGYLIFMLHNGAVGISGFVFLLGLVFQFSKWMDSIVEQMNALITFSTMMNQVRDFLDVEDEVGEIRYGTCLERDVCICPSITFQNVGFRYPEGSAWIFKNFNLKIRGGERLALVGINGAGKTTLMLMLMGLLHPTEGDILIDGKSYREFHPREYYRLFSPLFQDIILFPERIIDNITGGVEMEEEKLEAVLRLSGMDRIIESLPNGRDTYLVKNSQDKAIDLSGGQNQRLLLARALLKNAKINILDEPTAALDPLAESQIYEEYSRMTADKTSIFISHRLASTRFCDRIVLLEYGKIIEEGTHEELMNARGRYCEMYEVQSKYYQDAGIEASELLREHEHELSEKRRENQREGKNDDEYGRTV
ncbi:MAG: ATP-binding cassette domain-containing protein [Bacillota bacterium]|nr:ATP-binding cassette domain-containing protein [Bacillota bacterium]